MCVFKVAIWPKYANYQWSSVRFQLELSLGLWRQSLGQCPHYAGESWKRSFISTVRPTVHTNPARKRSWNGKIWKRNFISTVRPTVHTNPSRKQSWNGKIWKRNFISTARPTVHTNPSRKRSFSECSSNRRNLKMPALRFSVDRKHFENGAFPKRWRDDNHLIFLPEFFSNTNPKWPGIVAFSNFSGVAWTENIWCDFRVKTPFSILHANAICVFGLRCSKHGKGRCLL